jgi:hypothetical protein
MQVPALNSRSRWLKAAAVGVIATVGVAFAAVASDHLDTPLVEFNPKYDVNDVYAFPASDPSRIALVLGTQSPITPGNTPTAAFGDQNEVLYQLKVDNTGDGVEDLVFQFTFTGEPGAQEVRMQGPTAPNQTGTTNTLVNGKREVQGLVGTLLTSADGIRVFAGPRDDPFFIDLETFLSILPDRKPESGPLSNIVQGPFTFRPAGQAVDFLRTFNDMAIVVELPATMLTNNGSNPRFGVWGTTSNARKNTLATN